MTPSVHLTVAAIVCLDHKFLCVRETDNGKSCINQPAGHVEPGESIIEATCRETLEETGWRVEPGYLLGFTYYLSPHNGVSYHRITLACRTIVHETETIDPDIDAVLWLNEKELRKRSIEHRSPMVMRSVEDYLAGNYYPLEILRDYR